MSGETCLSRGVFCAGVIADPPSLYKHIRWQKGMAKNNLQGVFERLMKAGDINRSETKKGKSRFRMNRKYMLILGETSGGSVI